MAFTYTNKMVNKISHVNVCICAHVCKKSSENIVTGN